MNDSKEFRKVPLPPDLQREIALTDNARTVLQKRYIRKNEDGTPAETEEEMFWRVAYHVALADKTLGKTEESVEHWARKYYELLTTLRFFPNSPTFTGAGTPLGQLAACFVLPIEDDMGRHPDGIFQTLRNAALIQQTGGGNGFAFSRLRPRGAVVKSSSGAATGPVGFLRVYDQAFGEIAQGGCLTPDTLIFTQKGLLRLDEIVRHDSPGWMQHEYQVSTDEGVYPSYQGYNNGISPVLKIKTDAGIELTGTPNHKIQVMTENGILWKHFEELQPGDALMVKLGQHMGEIQTLVPPPKAHGNQTMPVFPTLLDEELAFFIGYMMGDGFIASGSDDHRVGVSVAHTSYLMEQMPVLIHRLFGQHLNIHTQQKANDASVTFVIDNRALKYFFLINDLHKPVSSAVSVPRLIRQSPPSVVGAFLRGLFEADGALSHHYASLTGSSETLIREVATLLIGLGCPVCISQQPNASTWNLHVHAALPTWVENSKMLAQQSKKLGQYSGHALMHQEHTAVAENDLWFVHVESVEDAGESLTLDFEVEGVHKYLANGIIVSNSRRGANMAVLRVDHPDIRDFIKCKASEGAIENFNISVGITDAFMKAVEEDTTYDLINPQDGAVWETIRAREIFDMIVEYAHHNGEPGVLFLDAANRENPVPHLYELESTNPCFIGETRIATEFGLLRIDDLAESGVAAFVAADNRTPDNHDAASINRITGVALRPASPAWMTRRNARVVTLTTKGGYQVTATPDHKILTPNGFVELQHLKPGDPILLQSGEGAWSRNYNLPNVEYMREIMAEMALAGNRVSGSTIQRRDFQNLYAYLPQVWSHDLGLIMGWLVGDGWISGNSGSPLGMVFSNDAMLEQIQNVMREGFGTGHVHNRGSLKQLTYGRVPYVFFKSLGVMEVRAHEKRVPESIWTAPREVVVGFLQGLFSADGTVHIRGLNDDCTVRLASSSPALLRDVQILLGNFGIAARICLRRNAGLKLMPDGKGGLKEYACHPQYEMILGRANRDRFAEMIGFADPEKQAKVESYTNTKQRSSNRETFTDPVLSIEDAGTADVYDLTQYQSHSLIANSLVVSNCGEQFLGDYENCCLGSVNLAQHVTEDGKVDWEKLRESVELSTRFLDHVITANAYVPAVPQLKEAAERVRRIGLGIMGLGDLMYAVGVRYGSKEGQEFASQIMEFVRYHSMKTSIELAKEYHPFPAIEGSRYDPKDLQWTIPQPLVPHVTDWGRPKLDWKKIERNLKKHGIRNGAQTTVAPTGTISTVSGCEGYGCEPVFALAYVRYVVNNAGNSDDRIPLQYTSPLFEQALRQAELSEMQINAIVEQVNLSGTCQHIPEVPEHIRNTFVVASDITVEEHIRMQASMQAWVDNAISKTINAPATATEEDVAQAYLLGWKLGCKGLTVYVTGSRDKVVLETKETFDKKKQKEQEVIPAEQPQLEQGRMFNEDKKPRPRHLSGQTYRIETPAGTTYVTINENGEGPGHPFEIFIHTGKVGSEVMAIAEATGRLVSYLLRLVSPVSPNKRLQEVARQLRGIGGDTSLGFGPNRVRSLPDGLAQVFEEYIIEREEAMRQAEEKSPPPNTPLQKPLLLEIKSNGSSKHSRPPLGDLCPECGSATLVYEEGCQKCYSCGFSKC